MGSLVITLPLQYIIYSTIYQVIIKTGYEVDQIFYVTTLKYQV